LNYSLQTTQDLRNMHVLLPILYTLIVVVVVVVVAAAGGLVVKITHNTSNFYYSLQLLKL